MQVARWGNSLAVRLPKALVDDLGLKVGHDLEVLQASKARLGVEKMDKRRAAVQALANMHLKLPKDYKFDRDEANAR
jgi:antitoxin MazE